jgi:hypothetical protein
VLRDAGFGEQEVGELLDAGAAAGPNALAEPQRFMG